MNGLLSRRALCAGLASLSVMGANARAEMGPGALSPQARDMMDRIQTACASGDPLALRTAIERNELPPVLERGSARNALSLLAARSADGAGRESLAILARTLAGGFVSVAAGASPTQYHWPRFARTPWAALNAGERAEAWGLVRVAMTGASTLAGEALFHTAQIGADGTWHSFTERAAPSPAAAGPSPRGRPPR